MAYSAIGGFPSQQLPFSKKERQDWVGKCRSRGLETKEVPDLHRKYDNHIFLVYMHVNKINGKVYTGITHHVNPNKRWGYSGQQYMHCTKFVNAINKYGWDNFDHIILCRTTKERAIVIEQTLIAHYKRLNMSYNIANGGEGSKAVSDETKEKLKRIKSVNPAMKGKHHTLEARARIAEANKHRVYTESQKEQIRKVGELGRKTMRERGYWLPKEAIRKIAKSKSKPVIQLDKDNKVIQEYSSASEADKFFSKGKGHHISDVCNGKRKSAYGFKWMYKEERRSQCI